MSNYLRLMTHTYTTPFIRAATSFDQGYRAPPLLVMLENVLAPILVC